MLKKFRSLGVATLVGLGGGALVGAAGWLTDLLGNTTTGTSLMGWITGYSALAGAAAFLFGLALILYGRFSQRGLDSASGAMIGGVSAPVAWVVLLLIQGSGFEGWGALDWLLILTLTALPGSYVGSRLGVLSDRDSQEPEPDTSPERLTRPDPLDRSVPREAQRERSTRG